MRAKEKCPGLRISIHALRVEGDRDHIGRIRCAVCHFYPRPPGGGRPWTSRTAGLTAHYFYPRPPGGGRHHGLLLLSFNFYFYPRPPGGGRRRGRERLPSIKNFYPRPPGGGRPCHVGRLSRLHGISIHALRVEGDQGARLPNCTVHISIHALRVEGDSKNGQSFHLFLRKREKNLPL